MNIYITKPNEAWLRSKDGSMSGIINKLLDEKRVHEHDHSLENTDLVPDPNNPNRAYDPKTDEYVRVKRVNGILVETA